MIGAGSKLVPIGECVQPIRTWNPARDSKDGTFQYIDISSVSQDEKRIIPNPELPTAEAPSRARQLVQAGDILISTVRPNLNAVAFVPDDMAGATASTGFCVLRPDPNRLCGRYLFHWVRTDEFVADMVKQATGQSYPAVSDKIVKQSRLPLPSLDEQHRIAAILDQADALRCARRRAIRRLDTLVRAIFYETFGDPTVNPNGWPTPKLGDLCEVVRGSSPRPQGDSRFFGGPVPRLMIADITRDGMIVMPRIDSLTEEGAKLSRPMPKGSVVMAVSGAVGLPAILDVDACIHDGFVGFRQLDPRIAPEFLYQLLVAQREQNKSQGTGAIWINLTTDQVKGFNVLMPPIKLQNDYVSKMMEFNKLKQRLNQHLANLNSLFSSLGRRVFHGEL